MNDNTDNNIDENIDENINKYIDQLTNIEKLVLETAIKQLESTFDISKSIGFLEWSKIKK